MPTQKTNSVMIARLSMLIVLQVVMLGALFTTTVPHPPIKIPLFAIAPFLGAAVAVALAAIILLSARVTGAGGVSLVAAFLALISFGPQKWVDPSIGLIWPAVLLGQVAAVVIVIQFFKQRAHTQAPQNAVRT